MTRASLARSLARKTGLSLRDAENLIISFCSTITESLEKGEKTIYSNFGTFYTVHYPSKTIFHPRLGAKKTMIMLPTNAAKWMPAEKLKDAVKKSSPKVLKEVIKKSPQKQLPLSGEPINNIEINKNQSIDENPQDSDNEKPINQNNDKNIQDKDKKNSDMTDIYEEILKDGSHEISTVKGSIKAHQTEKTPDQEQPDQANFDIDSKNDQETASGEQNAGPFDVLKQKFMFSRKNNQKEESKNEPVNSQPENPESKKDFLNSTNAENKETLSPTGTGTGIFDPSSGYKSQEKNLQKSPSENRIDQIKDEIKDGIETNSDSLPPENTNDGDKNLNETKADLEKSSVPYIFDKVNIQYKDLSKITVSKELLSKVPENIARKYKAVPIEDNNGVITLAMVDPEDLEAKEIFKRFLGENILIVLATQSDISQVLNQYQGLESEVSNAIASAEELTKEDEKEEKQGKNNKKQPENITDDAPAARIVSSLLKRAIRDKASDIHVEPTENEVEVRFRIDGVLKTKVSLPKEIRASVTSRIKILANLKIDEQRVPQDGRFNMFVDQRRVDFRVSTMPIAFGEKIVMRILDKETGILTVEQLGVNGSGLKVLEENLSKSHGMVLVTGPTGSGKSTTLYAMISKLYSEGINIVTLEDPIEYQIKGINQSQVNSEIGYTFASGLRSILRQDPDIVMLGEIRDKETAEMAVHAALTGHVVLSTLHTNDAAGAAPRLIDMGVEPFLLISSINVVIGQRLVRKICEDCRTETKLPDEEIESIKKEIAQMPQKEREECEKRELKFFKGAGCKICSNTGYKSRIGIYEVLNVNEEMQELILKRSSSAEINKKAAENGMVSMIQDGIMKALDGTITMEEVWRATKD